MSFTFTRQRSSSVNSLSSNHSMTPCVNNGGSGTSSGLSHPSTPVPPNLSSQPHHIPPLPPLSITHSISDNITTSTPISSTSAINRASIASISNTVIAPANLNSGSDCQTSSLPPPAVPVPVPPPPPPSQASSSMVPPLVSTSSYNHLSTTPILPPFTSSTINQKDSVTATPNSLRSMSIVSLDRSPRNSIISIDDNLRSHTRNNSTNSLASLSGHTATHGFTHIYPKQTNGITVGNSSAIISDDDSELDSSTPSRPIIRPTNRFKKRSNSREGTLKRDFKFKFDESITNLSGSQLNLHQPAPTSPILLATLPHGLSGSPTSSTITNISSSSKLNDPVSSPNSLTSSMEKHLKKLKTSNLMQQSMYIKRKLAISKDLQLEFYNSVSNNNNSNNLGSSLSSGSLTSPPIPPLSPPIISSELLDTKFFSPLLPNSVSRKSVTQPPLIPSTFIPPNLPIMQTLQEQNEMINKLNRKWNRSMISDTLKPKGSKKDMVDIQSDDNEQRGVNNLDDGINTVSNASTTTIGSNNATNGSNSSSNNSSISSGVEGTNNSAPVHTTGVNPKKRSRRILFDSDYDYESYDDYNYDIYDN